MKKVVFVIESLGFGGAERVVSVISKLLCEKYQIKIITFIKKEQEYEIDERIERINIDIGTGGKKFICGRKQLVRVLTDYGIDIVIGFDILPNILVTSIPRRKRKWKTIISERNAPKQAEISRKSKLLRKIYYRRTDSCIFQTKAAREYYCTYLRKHSVIIPNPIMDNLPEREYKDSHRFVAVGRLACQKNYPCMIKAFSLFIKENPEYTLDIYGEGEEKEHLEQLINELKLSENVRLCGSHANVHERIKDAQLYLMSSSYEGMPNALMEAMEMGFPVISSDCPSGGPAELIEDGVNGYLFTVDDCNGMKEKMCMAINNRQLEQMAEKAKKIKVDYSSQKIAAMWEQAIEKV